MNLHEYQAKHLFEKFGMPVPDYRVVSSVGDVQAALNSLGGKSWVVKAQVHAGGRGKAGGVKLVNSVDEASHLVGKLLGTRLVTYQTRADGQPINHILLEGICDIARELYLGAVIDRATRRVVIMASTEGGVDIEKTAAETPEKILRTTVDPMLGLMPYQCRNLGFGLGLTGDQINQFTKLLTGLARLFQECDLGLVEINPLVVTKEGKLICLDGKINVDDNA